MDARDPVGISSTYAAETTDGFIESLVEYRQSEGISILTQAILRNQ